MKKISEQIKGKNPKAHTIHICAGGGCISAGEISVKEALENEIKKYALDGVVKVVETGCMDACSLGPLMVIYPEGVFYQKLKPSDAKEIVEEHLLKGRVVQRLLYKGPSGEIKPRATEEIPFFTRQVRIATRNLGVIDPASIEEYIARDGYFALRKALSMTPEMVIEEIKKSGLRGRGGAGFPTGLKWELTRKSKSDEKYLICNADEGDPGAFMDRSMMEGDPHSLLEGMAIGGYAIGAHQGYIYVRAEYPLAIERLKIAIKQAREYGLLGKDIFGSGFDFDVDLRIGAGAFVCGEETALIQSVEGKRGQPVQKPPYPAQSGLWKKPTVINNVETLVDVPYIINKGWEAFASIGTEKSKGTKVFALVGKVNNTGLVEVPMGTTLRELIFDIGGGIPGGKRFKAVQTGGPSGGCIPEEYLDTPIDYESLTSLGTIMGSGGMIVMDEDTCMVDVARFFLQFTADESCGKCTPCREGTYEMLEILDMIVDGKGTMEDIEALEKLARVISKTALCGLGQTAPNPVLSTLRYFRDEYEAHVKEKRCPAKSCKALIAYRIDPAKCTGCTACARACPTGAITGEVRKVHTIDQEKCIKCGSCFEVCRFDAVEKIDAVDLHAKIV
ncbi:NADH-quinone oxidoreductase subunit NuoF [Athalassotoga saccharophila]|uniref:NADH-quinone oxidoreductase subunit NuoF n=1 Tax=Athalassotoga saccharophila TaxID=1441386 RepID=UPI001E3DD231|nr:NADH-quinone oxidoreductase subunit NuoF [Athalassotoga saccharophila]BBJ28956.1 NADP-reducing hydrogenase subunit HndC [Athalassotoga saccharophila]